MRFVLTYILTCLSCCAALVDLSDSSYTGMIQQPGYTNRFNGTFTNRLQITNSGTPESPLVFQWPAGAMHSAPTWNLDPVNDVQSSAAIYGSSFHDVIIDGAVINCTSNGNRGGLPFTNHNRGIYFLSVRNVEIKNCIVTNLGYDLVTTNAYPNTAYIPGSTSEPRWKFTYPAAGGDGIFITGQNLTNILVHNNFVDWAGNGLLLSMDSGFHTNIQFYSNTVYHCSWGLGWLQSVAHTTNWNGKIWANTYSYQTNYDGNPNGDSSSNPNHQDGMIISCNTTDGYNTNMQIFRNRIGPLIGELSSAYVYQETVYSSLNWRGLIICDNVFDARGTNEHPTSILGMNGNGVKLFNNTFVSHTVSGDDGAPLFRPIITGTLTALVPNNSAGDLPFCWTNNLVVNCGFAVSSLPTVPQTPAANFNAYFWPANSVSGFDVYDDNGLKFGTVPGSSTTARFPQWQTLGCDANGFAVTNNPMLNADLSIATNSPAAGQGVNLTALYQSIGIPAVDFYGQPRPGIGTNWDIGAFNSGVYVDSGGGTTPPVGYRIRARFIQN